MNGKEILWEGFHCILPVDSMRVASETHVIYLKPRLGDFVVDAGAHYGLYTMLASRLVGNGMVLSFEPHPENYRGLLTNLRLNGIENVRTFEEALGDYDGKVMLCQPFSMSTTWSTGRPGSSCMEVRQRRLDSVVAELGIGRLDLVKIDVEGGEESVIRGAEESIRRFRPRLTIAAYHSGDQVSKLKLQLSGMVPSYRFSLTSSTDGPILQAEITQA
jgi:FkbM family methyltransferase